MKDANGIVVLTVEQLRGLMSEVFRDELAKVAPQQSDVMDSAETAALLKVHENTLAKLIRVDGLPTLRSIGNLRRFSRRASLDWLARRKSG